jgi:hypothetical protein
MTYDEVKKYIFIAFIPLIYILMFRPDFANLHFLTYALMAISIVFIIIRFIDKVDYTANLAMFAVLLLLSSFFIALSIVLNIDGISMSSFFHIFKPLFFILILVNGYIIGKVFKIRTIKKGLLFGAYFCILIQILVGVAQLFDLSIFSFLYSSEKTRPIGSLVRIAGTMGNPNTFAWIIAQMIIIIYLFESQKGKKNIMILIGFILVFLSGSRSAFILYPIMIFFCKLVLTKKSVFFYFSKLPFFTLLFILFCGSCYWLLINFGSTFPYLYQIVQVVETGSLTSINSFDARTLMWENALNEFQSKFGIITLFFGLGPETLGVIDNDYLYSLINYGLLFTILNLVIYLISIYIFLRLKDKRLGALGLQYIIFSLIIGYQADTLSGWNFPILIIFFLGIVLAQSHRPNPIVRSQVK